jgi:hypothetical protein
MQVVDPELQEKESNIIFNYSCKNLSQTVKLNNVKLVFRWFLYA